MLRVDDTGFLYLREKETGSIVFRIRVPETLKQAFGRNEIQMNIPSPRVAPRLGAYCRATFRKLSRGGDIVTAFDPKKLRQVVRKHMHEIIREWREGKPLSNPGMWYQEEERIDDLISLLKERLGTRDYSRESDPLLARELLVAELRAYHQIKREMLGEVPSLDEPLGDYTWESVEMEPKEASAATPAPEAPSQNSEPFDNKSPAAQSPPATGPTLKQAVDHFVDHKLTTGKWSEATVKDMAARTEAMLMFFGEDTPINTITLDQGQLYVKRLQAMKQGFVGREGAWAMLHGELEDPSERPLLDVGTVREYLVHCRSFFSYCEALGMLNGSPHPLPAMFLPVKKKEARSVRKAFTPEQVESLLSSREFAKWSKGNPARKWIFPMLAFTGAQIEEICKLRKQDIKEVDGIPVIDINEDMGRNKNEHSNRTVPIHRKLLAMGLLEYANSLAAESMLFPELQPYKGRWSAMFLKAANNFLHNKAGFEAGYSNH